MFVGLRTRASGMRIERQGFYAGGWELGLGLRNRGLKWRVEDFILAEGSGIP